jgi:hypothetical protein
MKGVYKCFSIERIGIYKNPKKFLFWGLKRGFPFSGLRRVLRMLASVEGNHRVP